jgi:hypothetical protein
VANALRSEVEMSAVTTLATKRLGDDVSVRYRLERGEAVVLGLALVDLGAGDLEETQAVSTSVESAGLARKAHIDALLETLDLLGEVIDCAGEEAQVSVEIR